MSIKNGIAALGLATALSASVGCGEKYDAREFTLPYYKCDKPIAEVVTEIRKACATSCPDDACFNIGEGHAREYKPGDGWIIPTPYPGDNYINGSVTSKEENRKDLDEVVQCVEDEINRINKETGCQIYVGNVTKSTLTVKDGVIVDQKLDMTYQDE